MGNCTWRTWLRLLKKPERKYSSQTGGKCERFSVQSHQLQSEAQTKHTRVKLTSVCVEPCLHYKRTVRIFIFNEVLLTKRAVM